MGEGGTLVLVNGTPYPWNLTYQHSYQMNSWPFINYSIIPDYSSVPVYIEWNEDITVDPFNDAGEATYALAGTPYSFQIQARYRYIQVEFQSIATAGNDEGSTIGLGWDHNGNMPFILSGNEGGFSSNNPPVAWMQDNIGKLGPRTLRQLTIPGSHDAGMYELTGGTAFANDANTQTQTLSIGGQLTLGSRYFDSRPVISDGQYVSGHYSDLTEPLGWQGGNGESFDDIISDINDFTSTNKELIIVNLSHDYDTDTGRDYQVFTQAQWDALFELLLGINDLYVAPDPTTVDLTQLPLSDFIGDDNAAVVVIVQPNNGSITLGDYNSLGFYTYSQFNAYNSYSDTDSDSDMSSDQLQKMRTVRTSPDAQEFLLSWTLTQDAADAVTGYPTILDLAAEAMQSLYTDVFPACSNTTYPNIIFLDGWNTSDPTALALAIIDSVGG